MTFGRLIWKTDWRGTILIHLPPPTKIPWRNLRCDWKTNLFFFFCFLFCVSSQDASLLAAWFCLSSPEKGLDGSKWLILVCPRLRDISYIHDYTNGLKSSWYFMPAMVTCARDRWKVEQVTKGEDVGKTVSPGMEDQKKHMQSLTCTYHAQNQFSIRA